MRRRKFSREFKVEAVRLVRDRGVSAAQAARDLDVHENVLRKWVKEFAAAPAGAFPGHGQVKPEQLEIDRLRREVTKLKAERDILKRPCECGRSRTRLSGPGSGSSPLRHFPLTRNTNSVLPGKFQSLSQSLLGIHDGAELSSRRDPDRARPPAHADAVYSLASDRSWSFDGSGPVPSRLIGFLDADALPGDDVISREAVASLVVRTEKRRAIDADGNPLFKPRFTQLVPIEWGTAHAEQRTL